MRTRGLAAGTRFKLRIRSYGDGDGPVKLEVKRKLRDIIYKTSATVSPDGWSAAELLQLVESVRALPRILVRYERLAFSSVVDSYVRVTFDRRMICQPVEGLDLQGDPLAWSAGGIRSIAGGIQCALGGEGAWSLTPAPLAAFGGLRWSFA